MIINQIGRKFGYVLGLMVLILPLFAQTYASLGPPGTSASIRYVAPYGNDTGECSSREAPCRSIQYAVNQAHSGDTILVAEGVYTYNPSVDPCGFLPSQGKSVICVVDKSLTISGGYSTNNWGIPDPEAHPTVIDGEDKHRGVFLLGYNTTTASLIMEGFTIRNCRAEGPNTPDDPSGFGGGMLVSGARVTLRNMIFKNNKVFGQNTNSGAGGAASGAGLAINWSQPGSSSLLENVIFEGNQSFGGTGPERGGIAFGALFVNGSVTVNHAFFYNNQAIAGSSVGNGQSGGLCADALGGAMGGGGGSWALRHVVAIGNKVVGGNGAQCAGGGFGGAIHIERASLLSMRDSYFKDNEARGGNALNGGFGAGGAVLVNNTPATIERVQLIGNRAIGGNSTGGGSAGAGGGGGLYLWRTSADINPRVSIVNTIIADNYVDLGAVGDTRAGGGGGGIQIQGLQAEIVHSTIARNRLGPALVSGQGLLILAMPNVGSAKAYVRHTIIAEHEEGATGAVAVLVQEGSAAYFYRSLFAGNAKDTNADNSPMPSGTIELNAMIYASSAGFVSPGSPNYDYHVASTSPAVNQAMDSTVSDDIDGQPRPYGEAADIGADEYMPPRLTVAPPQVSVMVDSDTVVTRTVEVGVIYTSTPVAWTASISNPPQWLSFSPDSGQTGEHITLQLNSTGLPLGTYDAQIQITSPDADGVTLPVRLMKVEKVFAVHLPLVLRSH